MNSIIVNNKKILLDKDGYLLSIEDWNESISICLAKLDGIELKEEHWLIINHVRSFYIEFGTTPAIRLLVKSLLDSYGSEVGNSIYLQQLFPKGPAKQAAKFAGLPKPAKCL